jgi:hypothetical protein
VVNFLIEMHRYNIQVEVVFDGITPKCFSEAFSSDPGEAELPSVDPFYNYRNYGAADIIAAVKDLRSANIKHNFYFAPYEATPQLYYLHDSFMGASMCAYPDLLMYAWYNFIIDIDLEEAKFEWVKYSKENKLNEKRNLPKMFLNNGYLATKKGKKNPASVETIRSEVEN